MTQFRPMLAGDALLLEIQASQHFELGLDESTFTRERAEDLANNGLAWTAHDGARILCCAGFREIYRGHAVAWAAFVDPAELGRAGVSISRFARRRVADAPYRRIEALVEADNERAVDWSHRIGLVPGYLLRSYGNEGRDHILFERVK